MKAGKLIISTEKFDKAIFNDASGFTLEQYNEWLKMASVSLQNIYDAVDGGVNVDCANLNALGDVINLLDNIEIFIAGKMKLIMFENEKETAEMVVRLETANAKFNVIGRTTIMVDEDEPALVLPPIFVANLRREIAEEGLQLIGVAKHKDNFNFFISGRTVAMKGSFSLSDVMHKVRIL